jgi:hypothetical protein
MLRACKILAMLVVGIALGLATTWATAIRGSMGAGAAKGASITAGKPPVIATSTSRGIVLFRTPVNDERRLSEIDAARHNANCAPYKPG